MKNVHTFFLGCFFCCILSANDPNGWKLIKLAGCIDINVPPDLSLTETNPLGDYAMALFKKEGQLVFSLYIGNHPQFPSREAVKPHKKSCIRGYQVQEANGKTDSKSWKEYLLDLGGDQYWPKFVHYCIARGGEGQTKEAELIVGTLRYNPTVPPLRESDQRRAKGK